VTTTFAFSFLPFLRAFLSAFRFFFEN
jgi:hypothetical protein